MARVVKREAAKRDLISQWVWYAENAGIEIADRFHAAAESTMGSLAERPESGIATLFVKPELQGMRRFAVGDGFEKTLLFYFPL